MHEERRANLLFALGLAVSVAFALMPYLQVKVAMLAVFLTVNVVSGKRIRVMQTIVTFIVIVLFNLALPIGRELFQVLGFPVTEGALFSGLDKAVTFEGLILASRATVTPGLRLPGGFGRLVGESFRLFAAISSERTRFSLKDPIASVDTLLEKMERTIEQDAHRS